MAPSDRNPKKTARLARHAKFVSRIEKKSSRPTAAASKVRRPAKKLVSTLDSLAEALPDMGMSDERRTALESVLGRPKKGLKSRPGAQKRKETLLRSECERFGKNLAILESGKLAADVAGVPRPAVASSWATLRGFIGATLERKEEFVEMEKAKEALMDVEA